jgi:hypothetical protein
LETLDALWSAVGKEQREMPAHAIQEMLTQQRPFSPKPSFKEETLQRSFHFYNHDAGVNECLVDESTGCFIAELGHSFSLFRGWSWRAKGWCIAGRVGLNAGPADFSAFRALFEVRAAELALVPDLTPAPLDLTPAPLNLPPVVPGPSGCVCC